MKTNKLFSLMMGCLLAVTSFIPSTYALQANMGDPTVIVLRPVLSGLEEEPRNAVPFFAEYNELWNCVMLESLVSIGDVTVKMVSTAGDWYQTVFDTGDGSILIPVSGLSGHYTLTLVTSDGLTYTGEFDL